MRQLKIGLTELEMAFDGGREMISYYLGLETGGVVSASDEERSLLESIYESYYDEQTQTVDWDDAFGQEHVPDWQRERLQDADRVETGFGSRFIAIPSEGSMRVTGTWKLSLSLCAAPSNKSAWNAPIADAALSSISKLRC